MELRDYLAIVGRYQRFLASFVVLVALITAFLVARQPTHYEGSLTVTAFQDVPTQTESSTPYQFDSFYTLQTAGLYADHMKSRFADPSFVGTVFERANAPLPVKRLARLSRIFLARKQDPASVQITVDDTDEARVTRLLASAGAQLAAELSQLQRDQALTAMHLQVGEPIVVAYHGSVAIAGLVAAIASLLTGVALVLSYDVVRPRTAR